MKVLNGMPWDRPVMDHPGPTPHLSRTHRVLIRGTLLGVSSVFSVFPVVKPPFAVLRFFVSFVVQSALDLRTLSAGRYGPRASSQKVTGPSLVRLTCMSAPKRPLATG